MPKYLNGKMHDQFLNDIIECLLVEYSKGEVDVMISTCVIEEGMDFINVIYENGVKDRFKKVIKVVHVSDYYKPL